MLERNPYNVLGLDTSASQQEISKRSKEIITSLKIDEVPEYEEDFGIFEEFRTDKAVKEAVQELSSPRSRVTSTFFWIDVRTDTDEKARVLTRDKDFEGAIALWAKESQKKTADAFFYKKNLAVLYTLLLSTNGKKKYVAESLPLWKEIIESDKFWDVFFKHYELNDEISTNQDVLDSFRTKVVAHLSDTYSEIGKRRKDNSIILSFTSTFKVRGGKVEKDHLNPILERINTEVEKLDALKISEDGVFDEEESNAVNASLAALQGELKQLKKLGLHDDSKTRAVRDRAADALRTVVMDLHNNLDEKGNALAVLQLAADISGTDSKKAQLKEEVRTLRKNKKNEDRVAPILQLLKNEAYDEALAEIDKGLRSKSADKDLKDFYRLYKKVTITNIAGQKFKAAHELFNGDRFEAAGETFNDAAAAIEDNLDLFDFDKKGLEGVVSEISEWTKTLNDSSLAAFDEERKKLYATSEDQIPDGATREAYLILLDSYLMFGLAQFAIQKRGSAGTRFFRKAWSYGLWLLIIGGIIVAVASGSGDDSGSSGGSSGSSCVAEANSIKAQLDAVEQQATAAKNAGNTDGYNALVPRQNELASQYNAKSATCR